MMDDIKKSFNSILYERTTSPLYGTFIISWMVWNWKIIYLTLFIPTDKIEENKIDYILCHFSNANYLITYPLISTFLLLTIIPFIANGAYWLSLKFKKWKTDQKNKVNLKQLLTIEQSIELREQISNQEERFEKLLENKNIELKQLQTILDNSKNNSKTEKTTTVKTNNKEDKLNEEIIELSKKIKGNEKDLKAYDKVLIYVQGGHKMSSVESIGSRIIALLESYNIIISKGGGVYEFTETGKQFNKLMLN